MNVDYQRIYQERILPRLIIDAATGCWIYGGTRARPLANLYGQIGVQGRAVRTHRIVAHLFLELDMDSDLCVLHRCDNPPCCNPEHLWLGTIADNNADKIAKGRANFPKPGDACRKGHDLTAPGARSAGGRCAECLRIWGRNRRREMNPDTLPPTGEREVCAQGHPYTPENTYTYPDTGWRKCRTCQRAKDRAAAARKRGEAA